MSSAEIRPPPLPKEVCRTVCPAGAVQEVVPEDLSDQYETARVPASAAVTMGVVCPERLVVSPAEAKAWIGSSGSVPE